MGKKEKLLNLVKQMELELEGTPEQRVPAHPSDNDLKMVTTKMKPDVHQMLQRISYWDRTTIIEILDRVLVNHFQTLKKEYPPVPAKHR